MNPYYEDAPIETDRLKAFKHLIKMTNRWGGYWTLWRDPTDGDYLTFASGRARPAYFIEVAFTLAGEPKVYLPTSKKGSSTYHPSNDA